MYTAQARPARDQLTPTYDACQGFKPLATSKKVVHEGTTPLRPLQGSAFPG